MNQILIGIDHDVMRVYQAEAEKRGYPSGQALISALLADWPAILAPAAPKGAVTEAQETPFGGGTDGDPHPSLVAPLAVRGRRNSTARGAAGRGAEHAQCRLTR